MLLVSAHTGGGDFELQAQRHDRGGTKTSQNYADVLWMTPKSVGQVLFKLSRENSMPFCVPIATVFVSTDILSEFFLIFLRKHWL